MIDTFIFVVVMVMVPYLCYLAAKIDDNENNKINKNKNLESTKQKENSDNA